MVQQLVLADFSNSNFRKIYYRHIVVALFCCTYSVVNLLDFLFRNDSPENHPDTWKNGWKKKTGLVNYCNNWWWLRETPFGRWMCLCITYPTPIFRNVILKNLTKLLQLTQLGFVLERRLQSTSFHKLMSMLTYARITLTLTTHVEWSVDCKFLNFRI